MIGYFPELYPEELLYSGMARLCHRLGFPSHHLILSQCFRTANVVALIDLPRNLDLLVSVLPGNSYYTSDEIIDHHTLLPFYGPFVPDQRVTEVRRLMKEGYRGPVQMPLGLTRSQVQAPARLRFCPICQSEDMRKFGETYWHRLPQIAGIKVCPTHFVFVEESCVSRAIREKTNMFRRPTISRDTEAGRLINPKNSDHQILLRLAKNVSWVFRQIGVCAGPQLLQQAYLNLLTEQGFTTCNGRLYTTRLLGEFERRFSSKLLAQLHCQLQVDGETPWLIRLARRPKGVQSPIRHLLLIDFLGFTAEEFFTQVVGRTAGRYQPFGTGPWPCWNPVCRNGRSSPVRTVEVKHSRNHRATVGIFQCPLCGFTYQKLASGNNAENVRVLQFGYLWNESLRKMWTDPTQAMNGIGVALNVDPITVGRHAKKLGCRFPRLSRSREKSISAESGQKGLITQTAS